MRQFALFLIPLAAATLACRDHRDTNKVDAALESDLSMAGRSYTPLDTLSPAERAAQQRAAAAPTRTRVVYRTAPNRGYRVEKNTGRDAAIGAGAGAILGAATSRNKVAGAVVGAAAGGLLGAVIGNNVDKKKVPQ
jgi:hypothetical protein